MPVLLVLTSCPDQRSPDIAQAVVAGGMAACVNIPPPLRFTAGGARESASKCRSSSRPPRRPIRPGSDPPPPPHQVAEIVALPVTHGLPAYLNWVAEETIQS